MAKYVRTDSVGFIQEVSDSSKFNCDYEVGDSASVGKWVDKHNVTGSVNSIHDLRYYPTEMIKDMRNRLLQQTDFLVASDSPYIDNSTAQTNIKAYRQKLRDMFDADASKNWKSWTGYVSGDIFHSGIKWPGIIMGSDTSDPGEGNGTDANVIWGPQRDKDGFLLPGGPYHGAATHGHCTDDNAQFFFYYILI